MADPSDQGAVERARQAFIDAAADYLVHRSPDCQWAREDALKALRDLGVAHHDQALDVLRLIAERVEDINAFVGLIAYEGEAGDIEEFEAAIDDATRLARSFQSTAKESRDGE
jgi:hypothetical protein